jgi:hypothetical protein
VTGARVLAYFSQNPCIQQENSSNISFICIGLRFFQEAPIKWSVQIGAWVSAVVIGTDGTELWKLDIGHFQDPGGGIDLGEIDVATALAPDGTLYFGHSGGPTPEHIFVIAD